ncbi:MULTISPECIES: cohesin domain-containing protein [unclassified Paenibacillus]|uniref:cohesin domain-containing protein n=1 Tax=unclassified Paenibacillus TaxID=185978 RepID=UPI002404D49F|nr:MULTISPECIES: cohesin domain-containing protein [unclassified Paenibacillus]MDF9840000.1 hypothetical protein [Paenibacillus sp. PastF-2]MDF9846582.1 hypothetical protein [Paenibacillus sp. PastM-2]MDF9853070.1 hypothetical protein [Paenibacillus sp. PastF-1]MDH6478426.1 hypothetical protein [Paenibacillus sp. PastH-2]MDH6506076.1 hypothetical protein [Paenibacillus sp. PastM-3]
MNRWPGFKKYFKGTNFLTLMFSMMREVTIDNTPPAMTVEVTTDQPAYAPGDEVTVLLNLRNFDPNDQGYSYMNFTVQYDSEVFDNSEYLVQSAYSDSAFTPGSEVGNIFQFNFMNPVDGGIYFGMNTTMRGIDIQVETNSKHTQIPAVDQTLVTFKLRVKEHTLASSSTISLANEFTRIRTSEAGNSVYLYSPDITVQTTEPVAIIPTPQVSVYSMGPNVNAHRLA